LTFFLRRFFLAFPRFRRFFFFLRLLFLANFRFFFSAFPLDSSRSSGFLGKADNDAERLVSSMPTASSGF
jgi:hypothetical protein